VDKCIDFQPWTSPFPPPFPKQFRPPFSFPAAICSPRPFLFSSDSKEGPSSARFSFQAVDSGFLFLRPPLPVRKISNSFSFFPSSATRMGLQIFFFVSCGESRGCSPFPPFSIFKLRRSDTPSLVIHSLLFFFLPPASAAGPVTSFFLPAESISPHSFLPLP